jgi:hypothetical protein
LRSRALRRLVTCGLLVQQQHRHCATDVARMFSPGALRCSRISRGARDHRWPLVRELTWWWAVSVVLVVLAESLRVSPVVRKLSPLFGRPVLPTG